MTTPIIAYQLHKRYEDAHENGYVLFSVNEYGTASKALAVAQSWAVSHVLRDGSLGFDIFPIHSTKKVA